MKTILIISAVYLPEPVVSASLTHDIAVRLAENSKVIVVCPRPSRPNNYKFEEYHEQYPNITRIVLNSYVCPKSLFLGRLKESISFGKATTNFIEENKDTIECVYANTWPLFSQYLLLDVAKKNQIPCLIHIQDIYPESILTRLGYLSNLIGGFLKRIDAYYMNKATRIIAISDNMKQYLAKSRGIAKDKISVVRNWQDESKFLLQKKKRNSVFTYMFVGSISSAAGVSFLIESFIEANIENARLVIAGDGSDKEKCMKIAKASSHGVYIEFISVTPDTVQTVQAEADVLLLPLKKGIGMTATPSKLPAYMFSAKPIIASVDRDSDAALLVEKAGCGYVCDAENKEQFIDLLKKVYNLGCSIREELGVNGRIFALDNLSKEVNLNKIISLIENNVNGI